MPEEDDEVMKWKEEYSGEQPKRSNYSTFEEWAVARRTWCRWKERWNKILPFNPDRNHIYRQHIDAIMRPVNVEVVDMRKPKKKRKKK